MKLQRTRLTKRATAQLQLLCLMQVNCSSEGSEGNAHSMTAGRFEEIELLDFSHELHIPDKRQPLVTVHTLTALGTHSTKMKSPTAVMSSGVKTSSFCKHTGSTHDSENDAK